MKLFFCSLLAAPLVAQTGTSTLLLNPRSERRGHIEKLMAGHRGPGEAHDTVKAAH